MKFSYMIKTAALMPLLALNAYAVEIVVMPTDGDQVLLELSPYNTLEELDQHLNTIDQENGHWVLLATRNSGESIFPTADYNINDRESDSYKRDINEGARDYYYEPTAEDKSNISFIVKTLANHNEASLLFKKGQIEAAGARIEHIHPLKFLQMIFMDEELKVGMRNIRKKSWVWKSFRSGLCDSLNDEQRVDNMRDEYLARFCAAVDLDHNVVAGLYQQKAWRDFVESLVTNVPRKGDHRRYDM
ncbi:MAG: hypothetical protein Q8K75_07510 [Chlamydiales bacterium]|nr:hypothetical protein [Chlamydiales bacterium]